MSNKKSLVEEAIIQMKNLEETVAQNAKGILASTMKKEIKDLVKESIVSEEDDEEIDTNVKMDMDTDSDEDDVEIDMDVDSDEDDTDIDMDVDSDEDDIDMDMNVDSDVDDMDMDEPIDLTNHSDEEVMKVFKLMGPNDQIIVTKDNSGNINLKDGGNDTEYMLVGENEDENWNQEMSEEDDEEFDMDGMNNVGNQDMETNDSSIEDIINDVFGSSEEMSEQDVEDKFTNDDEDSEVVYEIEMDEEDDSMEMDEEEEDEEYMSESKMSIKPKGVGMGSPKFKYSSKPNQGQGFKTKMKQGNLKMGTGKPKFEFKEGENLDMEMTEVKPKFKKFETKEASRTYGNGSKSGRGLRKGITPNRNLTFESKTNNEIQILREKNEEYRKALNVFRNKLTEVAVFNSNLAYATRLFTEHTTSKHEKINILRRFDGVESIKESKNLYKSIKDELLNTTNQTMNESIERKIESTPVTGSVNLIESKTYENPQFARMKDLMSKIK
jgi:hypothetical protein